jgi:nucleoid-associated protein YgaU
MESSLKHTLKRLKAHEPTISIILGLLVLSVAGVLLLQQLRPDRKPQIESGQITSAENDIQLENQEGVVVRETGNISDLLANDKSRHSTYSVQAGDTLWSIAIAYFDNGFNWIDIAQTNGLGTGDDLAVGQTLSIPNAPVRNEAGELVYKTVSTSQEITVQATLIGEEHVVSKGESLWQIAQIIYGDGFQWTKLYDANSDIISDPNQIEVGLQLRIPA